jgi:hypothetical protein
MKKIPVRMDVDKNAKDEVIQLKLLTKGKV